MSGGNIAQNSEPRATRGRFLLCAFSARDFEAAEAAGTDRLEAETGAGSLVCGSSLTDEGTE